MKSSSSLYHTFRAALLFALALCSFHAVAAPGGSAIGSAPQGTLVIIGGGLRADNVAAAIAAVRPYGGDVISGVEQTVGRKDPARVGAFLAAVRG